MGVKLHFISNNAKGLQNSLRGGLFPWGQRFVLPFFYLPIFFKSFVLFFSVHVYFNNDNLNN